MLSIIILESLLIISAVFVIAPLSPVHSILWLVFVFICAGLLLILGGADYLAFIILIVYVGAIAILFLFVLMMLKLDTSRGGVDISAYLLMGLGMGLVWVLGLGWGGLKEGVNGDIENLLIIGRVFYSAYVYIFLLACLTLLIAMGGVIIITF